MPFPRGIRSKSGETIVSAYIVYKSRVHRDRVNAKVMKDKRLTMPKKMPFDGQAHALRRIQGDGGCVSVNLNLFDLAGFIGVLLIVIAYLLLQLDKLPSSALSFSLLNAAGSLLIMLSLIFKFNVSAFLIEVFWFLISLIGLSKWLATRKRLRIKAEERTMT